MYQERRATPKEQAKFERRMAKRNRRAGSKSKKYLGKIIGFSFAAVAFFALVMTIAEMS